MKLYFVLWSLAAWHSYLHCVSPPTSWQWAWQNDTEKWFKMHSNSGHFDLTPGRSEAFPRRWLWRHSWLCSKMITTFINGSPKHLSLVNQNVETIHIAVGNNRNMNSMVTMYTYKYPLLSLFHRQTDPGQAMLVSSPLFPYCCVVYYI